LNDLENLLNLDGEIFPYENGHWVKFEAKKVQVSIQIPHGIKYSLTLHDKNNYRVVGYDNAHGIKSTKKYGAKKITYDHIHKKEKIIDYEFETASQLIIDFWDTVDKYLDSL
jgi:hypothetical protein